MHKLQEKPYRIEERAALSGRTVGFIEFPNRNGALTAFNRSVQTGERVGLYEPDGPYRLVLLGPDHTVLPDAEDLTMPVQPADKGQCAECWVLPGVEHELSCPKVSFAQFQAFTARQPGGAL